jgi:probable selenium-dependent hydroxylase accessory protein YqeC
MDDNTRSAARHGEVPARNVSGIPRSAVVGVVLAAGSSRRFGENKLLAPFRGKPLLCWVIEAALRSRLAALIVVLGHEHERVRRALADFKGDRLTFAINESHQGGQSTSVIAGLAAVPPASAGAMFLVADQPLLDHDVIDRLIAAFEASAGGICHPFCEGRRGNPVIFGARFFPELRQLSGDRGGAAVIEAHRDAAIPVLFSDATSFRDIDYRSDLDLLSIGGAAVARPPQALVSALGLETARVISICGSGGKTSLMAALVREFAASAGERILATTTTKMATEEADGPWRACQATDASEILAACGDDSSPVLAYRFADHRRGRLLGFSTATIDTIAESGRFTRILVEADGSRRRPLKAPDAGEPAFPVSTTAVVMVAGLSGLGRPLNDDVVFRSGRWSELTGLASCATITPDSLACVIAHPDGLTRGAPPTARRVLLLNQADTPEHAIAAREVLQALSTRGRQIPECVVIGRLQPGPRICAQYQFCTPDWRIAGGGR